MPPVLNLQRDDRPQSASKAIGDIIWCDVREARLRSMIDEYRDFVTRVLRDARTPPAEIDDQVQLTFIVAARRLDDVRIGCEKAFLFRIAMHHAAHAQRTLRRRREVSNDEDFEYVEPSATPEQLTHVKKMRQSLDELLDQMETSARDVFIMHAFEELNTSEIATILGIPAGTVASRLRRARANFRSRASELGDYLAREGDPGAAGTPHDRDDDALPPPVAARPARRREAARARRPFGQRVGKTEKPYLSS